MQDVLDAIRERGWELLGQLDAAGGDLDPFLLEGEVIRWEIVHRRKKLKHKLEFHAFGDLGQFTDKLCDILYCSVMETGGKLYFNKRGSSDWREDLVRFVQSLEVDSFDKEGES